jgi:hypothetical protein
MANKWIKHLQQFRQKNKGMDARDLMKEARKSYQSGGGDVTPYSPTNLASTASAVGQQGGRRRKSQRRQSSRKSRRTRRR